MALGTEAPKTGWTGPTHGWVRKISPGFQSGVAESVEFRGRGRWEPIKLKRRISEFWPNRKNEHYIIQHLVTDMGIDLLG